MKCKEIKYYLNDYADGHLINEMREESKIILICALIVKVITMILYQSSAKHNLFQKRSPHQKISGKE
ncbi:MAG: hypothetical protein A2V93_05430 [Ignavibacteria bacterium RBG_16_34_14]|nr:MAG: hypothetical protein A2V93_05430 [Ignavibacteria bacterium RBG_16_34_14]